MKTDTSLVLVFKVSEATEALIEKARQLDKTLPTEMEALHLNVDGKKDEVRLTVAVKMPDAVGSA